MDSREYNIYSSFSNQSQNLSIFIVPRPNSKEESTPKAVLQERKNKNIVDSQHPVVQGSKEENKSHKDSETSISLPEFSEVSGPEEPLNSSNQVSDSLGSSFYIKDKEVSSSSYEEEIINDVKALDWAKMVKGSIRQWVYFFRDIVNKSMKERLKDTYAYLMSKKDYWSFYEKESPDNFYTVYYLVTLVQTLSYLFEDALPILLDMKKFSKTSKNSNLGPTDIAFLDSEIGTCYSHLGRREKAEIYYAKSKKLQDRHIIVRPCVRIYYLSVFGQHALRYQGPDQAISLFNQYLGLLEKLKDQEEHDRPSKTILLIYYYLDMSDAWIMKGHQSDENDPYFVARKFLELALEQLKAVGGERLHFMARIQRNYAQICEGSGKKEEASRHYEEALRILHLTLPEGNYLERQYMKESESLIHSKTN